jgi:hypothetical protein
LRVPYSNRGSIAGADGARVWDEKSFVNLDRGYGQSRKRGDNKIDEN